MPISIKTNPGGGGRFPRDDEGLDTDGPSADCAATTNFGLRREAKRHAALGSNRPHGKRCRRYALPPQSKSLPSGHEVAGLYYELKPLLDAEKLARLLLLVWPWAFNVRYWMFDVPLFVRPSTLNPQPPHHCTP